MSSKSKNLPFPLEGPTDIADVLVESGLAGNIKGAKALIHNGKVQVLLDCVSPKVLVTIHDPQFKVNPAFRGGER